MRPIVNLVYPLLGEHPQPEAGQLRADAADLVDSPGLEVAAFAESHCTRM